MVITTDDIINITPSDLASAQPQQIEWKQRMSTKKETYVICTFQNLSKNDLDSSGKIFIQQSKLEELKNKKMNGKEDFHFTIDRKFQYGEPNKGGKRWLVYHDQGNVIFQHRFVESTIKSFGNNAGKMMSQLGYGDVSKLSDIAGGLIGNQLMNFH